MGGAGGLGGGMVPQPPPGLPPGLAGLVPTPPSVPPPAAPNGDKPMCLSPSPPPQPHGRGLEAS